MELVLVGTSAILSAPLVPGRRLVIGRGDDVEVTIDDRRVSRAHLALAVGERGDVTIEDLGSRNGTILGAARLAVGQVAEWAPNVVCVFGSHLAWLEPERTVPRWVSEATFDDAIARSALGGERLRIFEVRTLASTSTETSDVEFHRAATEERDLLTSLRALLRVRLDDPHASRPAFVTRRPNGALLVAITEAQVPSLLRDDDDPTFDFVPRRVPSALERSPEVVSSATPPPGDGRAADLDRDRVARSEVTVLILGETGSGKELAARDLHARSTRAQGRFVVVNCASIAESLFEAELFGHEKGAFTGAVAPRRGYLESANGGTLLLDEIAELPRQLQAKLLRVFEDRSIQRVGGVEPRPIDVRFLAATHRDLAEEVAMGRFREDLYFRLCGVVLRIPPLRERRDELPRLAEELLTRLTTDPVRLSERALDALGRHPWPGNVRELRAVLDRALLLRTGLAIEPEHLVFEYPTAGGNTCAIRPSATGHVDARHEKIRAALEATHGNQTKAAAFLGISRRTLTNWLNELGLPRPRKGSGA